MADYSADGLDDDRIARAAKRILRQYHIEQHDRSEDAAVAPATKRQGGSPDDPTILRALVDDLGVSIENLQRLFGRREDVFLAVVERLERNLAKTDGRLDALQAEIAGLSDRPAIQVDRIIEDQRVQANAILQEFGTLMATGRVLLDETREIHAAVVSATRAARN